MTASFAPQSPADLADLVRSQPLAWVVSGTADHLHTSVLPVQLVCDAAGQPVQLLGHFGRSNPQWRALAEAPRASVLLLGPQGYVSPSWFRNRSRAPTWNYTLARFDVDVTICDTPADADALLRGLAQDMESARPAGWHPEEMGARYGQLSQGIVGFRAQVREVRSCFKLGQDERDDVFADILQGLDIQGQAALAGWMRRFGTGRPDVDLRATLPDRTPLDPEVMRFIDDVRNAGREMTAGRQLDWPQRREVAEHSRRRWHSPTPQMARTQEHVIDTEVGPVRLRIHDPGPLGGAKPALLYLHGGGWALFSLDTHDHLMRSLAERSGMVVVGVDYALAPEARFPVALNQVIGVVRWLREHGAAFGIDPEQLTLGGDSAGANISMGAALKLRDLGEPDAVKALLCIYGGYTPYLSPTSRQRYGTEEDMLTAAEVDEFWGIYIGHLKDLRNPYAAAALSDPRGLPPTFLIVAECDVLAEQNLQMAGLLLQADVPVKVKVYPGAPHSFIEALAASKVANQAVDDGAAWLRTTLSAPHRRSPPSPLLERP